MASDKANLVKRLAFIIDGLFLGGGHPSSWHQESCKAELFELFRSHPTLAGDMVREFAHDLWPLSSDQRSGEKLNILEQICSAWDEWRYARSKLVEQA